MAAWTWVPAGHPKERPEDSVLGPWCGSARGWGGVGRGGKHEAGGLLHPFEEPEWGARGLVSVEALLEHVYSEATQGPNNTCLHGGAQPNRVEWHIFTTCAEGHGLIAWSGTSLPACAEWHTCTACAERHSLTTWRVRVSVHL